MLGPIGDTWLTPLKELLMLKINIHFSPGWYGTVGWSIILNTESLEVQFLVRANTQVSCPMPGPDVWRSQLIKVFLWHSLSFVSQRKKKIYFR